MAEHNQRTVCPKCGLAHNYHPSELRKAGVSQPQT